MNKYIIVIVHTRKNSDNLEVKGYDREASNEEEAKKDILLHLYDEKILKTWIIQKIEVWKRD